MKNSKILSILLCLALVLLLAACSDIGKDIDRAKDDASKVQEILDTIESYNDEAEKLGSRFDSFEGLPDGELPGSEPETEAPKETEYRFRNKDLLESHYKKHGKEMGFQSAKEYEKAASDVINNPAALYKTEAEDGDGVYYVEGTNEFVILSTDGYIRTYFCPDSGKKYFDKQ